MECSQHVICYKNRRLAMPPPADHAGAIKSDGAMPRRPGAEVIGASGPEKPKTRLKFPTGRVPILTRKTWRNNFLAGAAPVIVEPIQTQFLSTPSRTPLLRVAASSNPAFERDWPISAFFMACRFLNIRGSGQVWWSASPSI